MITETLTCDRRHDACGLNSEVLWGEGVLGGKMLNQRMHQQTRIITEKINKQDTDSFSRFFFFFLGAGGGTIAWLLCADLDVVRMCLRKMPLEE